LHLVPETIIQEFFFLKIVLGTQYGVVLVFLKKEKKVEIREKLKNYLLADLLPKLKFWSQHSHNINCFIQTCLKRHYLRNRPDPKKSMFEFRPLMFFSESPYQI
jgi:hypothetical protein